MKDYREIAESVLKQRDEYVAKKARRKRKIIKTLTPAVCCCLIAALGIGVFQQAVPDTPPNSTKTTAGGELDPDDPDRQQYYITVIDGKNVIVGYEKQLNPDSGLLRCNEVIYTENLYEAMKNADEDDYVAVYAEITHKMLTSCYGYYVAIDKENYIKLNPMFSSDSVALGLIDEYNNAYQKSVETVKYLINEKGYSGIDAYNYAEYIALLSEMNKALFELYDHHLRIVEYNGTVFKVDRGNLDEVLSAMHRNEFKSGSEYLQEIGFTLLQDLSQGYGIQGVYMAKAKDVLSIINKEKCVNEYVGYYFGLGFLKSDYRRDQ